MNCRRRESPLASQRLVFLDTETTGLEIQNDERIIEIAALEVIDGIRTGNEFYTRLNPDKRIAEESTKIHGIKDADLIGEPTFTQIVDDLLNFINGSKLVIHNAAFDVGFLNAELTRAGREERIEGVCEIIDSLDLARQLYPGQLNNLDALARRHRIELKRDQHDARLDASMLVSVYTAMVAKSNMLLFDHQQSSDDATSIEISETYERSQPIVIKANADELRAHEEYVSELRDSSMSIEAK